MFDSLYEPDYSNIENSLSQDSENMRLSDLMAAFSCFDFPFPD